MQALRVQVLLKSSGNIKGDKGRTSRSVSAWGRDGSERSSGRKNHCSRETSINSDGLQKAMFITLAWDQVQILAVTECEIETYIHFEHRKDKS